MQVFVTNMNHVNLISNKNLKLENLGSPLIEENRIKIKIDPLSNFLSLIQKITNIALSKKINKHNLKKTIVDIFYNEIFLKYGVDNDYFKSELNKVINSIFSLINLNFDLDFKSKLRKSRNFQKFIQRC